MSLTATDLFAGAGGSSTGMIAIPGVEVRIAANHWQLACDVHNANHPDTDHAVADIHQADPHYFPTTDILWASPECTKWSQANGSRLPDIDEGLFEDPASNEAAVRSRMLMFDVPRFAEVHRYRRIIVENVVDVAMRPKYKHAFTVWLHEMSKLGYRHRVVSLNSMHAQFAGLPAPQSRDRLYVIFWRKGDKAPDIDKVMRPRAWCARCEQIVESQQAFKPGRTVGKYRDQYIFIHGACGTPVDPAWLPAAAAIDWSVPGQPINGRLKPKTRARIAAGIARYWAPFHLEAAGNTFDAADPAHRAHGDPSAYYRIWSAEEVLTTLHTTASKALAVPVEGRDGKQARTTGDPLRAQTNRAEAALVTPFLAELRGGGSTARSVADPAATFTANGNHHGLVQPTPLVTRHYGIEGGDPARHTKTVDEALRTVTATGGNMSLLTPAGGSWNDEARPTEQPHRALTTRDTYALVTPYYGTATTAKPTGDPLGTLTTRDRYALVHRHNTGGAEMLTPAEEYLRTITTAGHQSLVTPGDLKAAEAVVDDCLFRMLRPHEVAAGMAFPGDYDWQPHTKPFSNRDLVKMAGNAVTPPAARDLMAAVVESLA